jgi:hypothetical protein
MEESVFFRFFFPFVSKFNSIDRVAIYTKFLLKLEGIYRVADKFSLWDKARIWSVDVVNLSQMFDVAWRNKPSARFSQKQ